MWWVLQVVCGLIIGMTVFFMVPVPGPWAYDLRTAVAVLASAAVGVLLAPPSRPATVGRKVLAVFGGAAAVLALLFVGWWLIERGFADLMVGAGLVERSGLNSMELRPTNFLTLIFVVLALVAICHAAVALVAIACAVVAPVSALLAIRGRPAVPSRPAKPGAAPDRDKGLEWDDPFRDD